MSLLNDNRFRGFKTFERKIWLASPTMYGDEQKWVDDSTWKNLVSTVGENINVIETKMAELVGDFRIHIYQSGQ